jgi:hypothetical protein
LTDIDLRLGRCMNQSREPQTRSPAI